MRSHLHCGHLRARQIDAAWIDVDVIEKIAMHEGPIRLGMFARNALVFIQIETCNLRKRKPLLTMQADQFLIQGNRRGSSGQSQHGIWFGTNQGGDFLRYGFDGGAAVGMGMDRKAHDILGTQAGYFVMKIKSDFCDAPDFLVNCQKLIIQSCQTRPPALPIGVPDAVYVKDAFARIADRYVMANHVMSGGMDIWWRKRVAWKIRSWKSKNLLDVASGTGDLALEIQETCPDLQIMATDFCAEMLEHASLRGLPQTMVADALNLPFAYASFDVVTVAFGLRNMADYPAALREMSRVLAPGGRLVVLDFSLPGGILRAPYRWYLHRILPKMAGYLTGQKDAYEYLGASIEQFPQGDAMCQLMRANGFADAEFETMTLGVVSLYTATK